MTTEDAVNDFLKRIDHYCSRYQTIDEENEKLFSFMKTFDAGTSSRPILLVVCSISTVVIAEAVAVLVCSSIEQVWIQKFRTVKSEIFKEIVGPESF